MSNERIYKDTRPNTLREARKLPDSYCGFGSCDLPRGHDFDHRCRCGQLVRVPNYKCEWHPVPPGAMTANLLVAYLEHLEDFSKAENEKIMVGDKDIVGIQVLNGRVVLETWDDALERQAKVNRNG